MAPRGEIFDKKLAQEAIDECDNMKGGVILLFTDGRSQMDVCTMHSVKLLTLT